MMRERVFLEHKPFMLDGAQLGHMMQFELEVHCAPVDPTPETPRLWFTQPYDPREQRTPQSIVESLCDVHDTYRRDHGLPPCPCCDEIRERYGIAPLVRAYQAGIALG